MQKNSDDSFFTGIQRGELAELRAELQSTSNTRKRQALKRVIASMTLGKDVSSLFTDVIGCMQSPLVEIKKLVYLYLINHAQIKPELSILAVNSFLKDSRDPNPLLRALSIRTMAYIRVDRIQEHLCEPLRRGLTDSDPYVRKTAAIAVAKLYEAAPRLVRDQEFLMGLQQLLDDSNPMVVSNAVAALADISSVAAEKKSRATNKGAGAPTNPDTFEDDPDDLRQANIDEVNILPLNSTTVPKLLAALNECNEWGQVYIMSAITTGLKLENANDADAVIERVVPRLSHANPAVVVAAVRLIASNLHLLPEDSTDAFNYLAKCVNPLITQLSAGFPETQYIALRVIATLMKRFPQIPINDVRAFYCKYNDPLYVKLEKLNILIMLADDNTVQAILSELKEYCLEVDRYFVKKAVGAIGAIIVKLEESADYGYQVLDGLVKMRGTVGNTASLLVEQVFVCFRDILRRYPGRFDTLIFDSLTVDVVESVIFEDSNTKAALVWIIGEFCGKLGAPKTLEIMEPLTDSFLEDPLLVQYQVVTASIKILTLLGQSAQPLHQKIFDQALHSNKQELRDRVIILQRLVAALLQDPQKMKSIIFADKPIVVDRSLELDKKLMELMIANLGMLSNLFYRAPSYFGSYASGPSVQPVVQITNDTIAETNKTAGGGDFDLLGDLTAPGDSLIEGPDASGGDASGGLDMLLGIEEDDGNMGSNAGRSSGSHMLDLDSLYGNTSSNLPALSSTQEGGSGDYFDDLLGPSMGLGRAKALPGPAGSQFALPAPPSDGNGGDYGLGRLMLEGGTGREGGRGGGGGDRGGITPGSGPGGMIDDLDISQPAGPALPDTLLLPGDKGKGLIIKGGLSKNGTQLSFYVKLENQTGQSVSKLAIQFNKNTFGLLPLGGNSLHVPGDEIANGHSAGVHVALKSSADFVDRSKGISLQIAVKCVPLGVFYFMSRVMEDIELLIASGERVQKSAYLNLWASVPNSSEVKMEVMLSSRWTTSGPGRLDSLVAHMEQHQIYGVAQIQKTLSDGKPHHLLYFSNQIAHDLTLLSELDVAGSGTATLSVRCPTQVPSTVLHSYGKAFAKFVM